MAAGLPEAPAIPTDCTENNYEGGGTWAVGRSECVWQAESFDFSHVGVLVYRAETHSLALPHLTTTGDLDGGLTPAQWLKQNQDNVDAHVSEFLAQPVGNTGDTWATTCAPTTSSTRWSARRCTRRPLPWRRCPASLKSPRRCSRWTATNWSSTTRGTPVTRHRAGERRVRLAADRHQRHRVRQHRVLGGHRL